MSMTLGGTHSKNQPSLVVNSTTPQKLPFFFFALLKCELRLYSTIKIKKKEAKDRLCVCKNKHFTFSHSPRRDLFKKCQNAQLRRLMKQHTSTRNGLRTLGADEAKMYNCLVCEADREYACVRTTAGWLRVDRIKLGPDLWRDEEGVSTPDTHTHTHSCQLYLSSFCGTPLPTQRRSVQTPGGRRSPTDRSLSVS